MQPKDVYCSYCGTAFPVLRGYPKHCNHCKNYTYLNAPAVGVGLIPINNGLLHVRRAIKPCIGELALPGGYKNVDESWEQGIAREVFEETGILVDASTITLINVKNANNGAVIVFGLSTKLILQEPIQFKLDHETMEALVLNKFEPLCFPHHTTMAKWFWEQSAQKAHLFWSGQSDEDISND